MCWGPATAILRSRLARPLQDKRPIGRCSLFSRSITVAFLLMLGVLATGVVGYMFIEHWNFIDSLWMVVITLTTIGFGEIHPMTDGGRIFTMALIVMGVSVGGYTMTRLTSEILDGQFWAAIRHRRRQQVLDQLQQHFIVVGFGRLGRTIVEELLATGVPVCVIERNPVAIEELERTRICPYVVGDGSHDEVLKQAGIHRARGMAVAVSSGAEAVYATLSARVLGPNLNIITRVTDPEHALKAKRAGATSVVNPHTMGGWRMAHGMVRPHATSFLDLATLASHEDILLEEYEIGNGTTLAGKTLGALRIGEKFGVMVIAVRQADGRMVATPDAQYAIHDGDVMIVVGTPEKVRTFGKMALAK